MQEAADVLIIKSGITPALLKEVKDEVLKGRKTATLYLVIDTNGGSGEVAYRTMRLLNKLYDRILAVIPDRAMSAGTLMVLVAIKSICSTVPAWAPSTYRSKVPVTVREYQLLM